MCRKLWFPLEIDETFQMFVFLTHCKHNTCSSLSTQGQCQYILLFTFFCNGNITLTHLDFAPSVIAQTILSVTVSLPIHMLRHTLETASVFFAHLRGKSNSACASPFTASVLSTMAFSLQLLS